jgi:hypothetical protein
MMNVHLLTTILGGSLLCILIACNNSRHIIRVTGVDKQNLYLKNKNGSPADTIEVREGDKVLWRIKTKEVQSITEISEKPDKPQPQFITGNHAHKKRFSKTWVEKVNLVAQSEFHSKEYVEQFYFIEWLPKGSKDTLKYDPLMRIYPNSP